MDCENTFPEEKEFVVTNKRNGILIAYLNLALGMVVNIFLTPMLISSLGDVDYSLYKVIQSFAGPLSMFNLGISTIVTRSIVQFATREDYTERDKKNTMAHAMLASGVMALVVCMAGLIMCRSIPRIYGESYSVENLALGQKVFLVFLLSTVLHMMTDAFSGCLVGHERFTVNSLVQFSGTLLKIVLLVLLVLLGTNALWIACVDLLVSLAKFLFSAVYATFFLHETPRFYYFDRKKLTEIILFGAAILLQAIVNQVNNNVDTMILGAYVSNKAIITMYTSALTIYAIYNSLISVIASFFLPKATRLVTQNASGRELTDFVIGPGRFQAVLATACIFGFALCGQNFISVWIGDKYSDAYWITLMLMIPVTIPLVENVMISVLDAALKRMYRSVTLVIMALLNVVASLVLVRLLGFWGTAIGTVMSLLIGHGVLMNAYYAKTFRLQVFRMFYSIFRGILPAGLAAAILCLPLTLLLPNTIGFFLVKGIGFMLFYGLFLQLFGLNPSEKKAVRSWLKRDNRGAA